MAAIANALRLDLAQCGGTVSTSAAHTTSTCETSFFYGQAPQVVYVREDSLELKPTRIKCEYCAQMNSSEWWNCHECGGPLPF
jgi:hypothetical protein